MATVFSLSPLPFPLSSHAGKSPSHILSFHPFPVSVFQCHVHPHVSRSRRLHVAAQNEASDDIKSVDRGGEGKGQVQVLPSMGRMDLGDPAYNDTWLDLAFIQLCRQAFGRVAGWQSERRWSEGYLGMVEVSHALMRGRRGEEQREAVLMGFPSVPPWFRQLFPYSDWGAEVNASITPRFFEWLVGPCEVESGDVEGRNLRSVVAIKRCRYLDTSGCVGMCVNLCKAPTQHFFNQELGMPLTMEPNFETLGCRMVFGQTPPPLEEDPAFLQSCFATCPSANPRADVCPKLK